MMSQVARPFETEETARGEYRAPAAEKVLDILEFMATQSEALTQTAISSGLGRSIHEIYRILYLLEKRGYLVRTKSDRFRLSLKLFELAHMYPPVNLLVESALPAMRELAANSDQSCHLVVLKGQRALVVVQVDSPLPMRYSVALGSQFPILETSAGTVIAAHLPDEERRPLVDRIFEADEAEASREDVEERLLNVCRLGFEMRPSLTVEGSTNISLPIRDYTGSVVAALTVPFLPQKTARFDKDIVFTRTAAAAEQISVALGAGDPGPVST
jgi:DNA-binding IclR family transcriptional regulator